MAISVSEAAKGWGVSRTTVYQKINSGELSRGSDKKIDVSEMLRVFGEPPNSGKSENVLDKTLYTVQKTPMNTISEHLNALKMEHQLEVEKLKNEHLEQQVNEQKALIEDYQQQIKQLNQSLAQATSSINEFAQTRLLELKINQTNFDEESPQEEHQVDKKSQQENEHIARDNRPTEQVTTIEPAVQKRKKWRWW